MKRLRHRLHVRRARRDEPDAAQARRLARGRPRRALGSAAARRRARRSPSRRSIASFAACCGRGSRRPRADGARGRARRRGLGARSRRRSSSRPCATRRSTRGDSSTRPRRSEPAYVIVDKRPADRRVLARADERRPLRAHRRSDRDPGRVACAACSAITRFAGETTDARSRRHQADGARRPPPSDVGVHLGRRRRHLRRRAPRRHRPVRRGRPRARRHAHGDDQRRVDRAGGPERPARRDGRRRRARPSSRPTIPTTAPSGWPGPTMVAVFADASSNAQVRTSAGALNDAAAWTPPVDIGYADYPRLAGGPSGLFLLSGTPQNALTVRKFNGTTFGPAVKIADAADDAQAHLTQDATGRLHAVFAHNTVAGLQLRLRDVRQRRRLAVGSAADPDQRPAGHRPAARSGRGRPHRCRCVGDVVGRGVGSPRRRHRRPSGGALAAGCQATVGGGRRGLRAGLRHLDGPPSARG